MGRDRRGVRIMDELHNVPEWWGTAINVQAMVFGNLGETSATGVAFSRNPSTGDRRLYGEFLINAQGEDVVAGIRTPQEITEIARKEAGSDKPSMERAMPGPYGDLFEYYTKLEKHYRDMQDMEFTVEQGKLWMLQTRTGKRTAAAALKIAVELANEGVITKDEAVTRVEPALLDQLLHPTIDPKADRTVIGTGLPASPGAACGEIVFDFDEAEQLKGQGHNVVLVRVETSPEDHPRHACRRSKLADDKILVQQTSSPRPVVMSRAELEAVWDGSIVLMARRAPLSDLSRRFDITWFLGAIHKYRRLLGEVFVASFFLQIFALASPLFFQVVIDKVLVHRSMSTLEVLVFGLVAVSVFETNPLIVRAEGKGAIVVDARARLEAQGDSDEGRKI